MKKNPIFSIFSVLFQNSQKNIQEKHGRSQAERVFFFFSLYVPNIVLAFVLC